MLLAYFEILKNRVILGDYQILLSNQIPTYSSNLERTVRPMVVQYGERANLKTWVPLSLQIMVTMVQKQVIISIFSADYFFRAAQ